MGNLVEVVKEVDRSGILQPGDVRILPDAIAGAIADIPEGAPDGEARRALLAGLEAPYKRVVLAGSHIHTRKRQRHADWDSRDHLAECLRQHRAYFRRRGVATSLDMDPKAAFGDKGVTSTANDRDVFVAFMTRIGLRDAVSANAIAAQVVKALRSKPLTAGMPESFYGVIFQTMTSKPGQNVERPVFDEAIKGSGLEDRADEVYDLLCQITGELYDKINAAIMAAHSKLQVALTLEKEGIAAFSLNTPFGLAIPFEGSLFRVYELDQAQHLSRVCPTFFTITGGGEDDDPFEVHAISHGGFEDLEDIHRFRIGEVYIPVTVAQRRRVSEFALEHCQFDLVMLDQAFSSGKAGMPEGSDERAPQPPPAAEEPSPQASRPKGKISGIFDAWDRKTGEDQSQS